MTFSSSFSAPQHPFGGGFFPSQGMAPPLAVLNDSPTSHERDGIWAIFAGPIKEHQEKRRGRISKMARPYVRVKRLSFKGVPRGGKRATKKIIGTMTGIL